MFKKRKKINTSIIPDVAEAALEIGSEVITEDAIDAVADSADGILDGLFDGVDDIPGLAIVGIIAAIGASITGIIVLIRKIIKK